jgi:hypothetical protein
MQEKACKLKCANVERGGKDSWKILEESGKESWMMRAEDSGQSPLPSEFFLLILVS